MTGEEGAVSEATDGLRLLTPVSVEEELRHRITNLESSIHAHQQLTERFKRQRDEARAEASELREEVARRVEDIRWQWAAMYGEPHLAEGENEHNWTTEGYESRYIGDYDPEEPGEHKLRRVKCATCGQTLTDL